MPNDRPNHRPNDRPNEESALHARELSLDRLVEMRQAGALDLDLLLHRDLWDGRTYVRRNAAAALALFEDVEHPRLGLLGIASRDGDPVVREHAAVALGRVRLDAQAAVAALLRARVDLVTPVAEAAQQALERILLTRPTEVAPLLIPALGDAAPPIRATAADLLLKSGAHGVRPLVAGLGNPDPNVADLCAALLDRLGSMTTDALIDALAEVDSRRRAAALLRHHPPRTKSQRERLDRIARGDDAAAAEAASQLQVDMRRRIAVSTEEPALPHPAWSSRALTDEELAEVVPQHQVETWERASRAHAVWSRANAVRALAHGGYTGEWRRALRSLLADDSSTVRAAAAATAASLLSASSDSADVACDEVADALAKAVTDGDGDVAAEAWAAVEVLATSHPALAVHAAGGVTDNDGLTIRMAGLPDPSLSALAAAAMQSPRGQVRQFAVEVVGRAASTTGAGALALIDALSDPIDEIRRRAAWALGQGSGEDHGRREALRAARIDPVAAVRREAYLALAKLDGRPLPSDGPSAEIAEPVDGFFTRALDPAALAQAATVSGPEAMGALLRDGRAVVRRNATVALGALGIQASTQLGALHAALRDADAEVREAAVAAVSAVSASQADERAQALVAALHDRSASVREAAERVIEGLGAAALAALLDVFDEDPGFVRGYIFPLIIRIGAPAIDELVALLAHSSPQRRSLAAELLGRMATLSMAPVRKALESMAAADTDLRVRSRARRALQRLIEADESRRMREASPMPIDGFDERPLAAAELAKSKKKLEVDAIVGMLSDGRTVVRCNAATALGVLAPADESVAGALALRLRDSEPMVRLAAARALGSIGNEAGAFVPDLLRSLRNADPEQERAVVDALEALTDALTSHVPVFLAQRPEAVMPTMGRLAQRRPDLLVPALANCLAQAPSLVARENAADILTLLGAQAEPATQALLAALDETEVLLRCKVVRALALAAPPSKELHQALAAVAETDPHVAVQEAVEAALRILRARANRGPSAR